MYYFHDSKTFTISFLFWFRIQLWVENYDDSQTFLDYPN